LLPTIEASQIGGKELFLDVHELGAGNVKASDVVGVHQKDLRAKKIWSELYQLLGG